MSLGQKAYLGVSSFCGGKTYCVLTLVLEGKVMSGSTQCGNVNTIS